MTQYKIRKINLYDGEAAYRPMYREDGEPWYYCKNIYDELAGVIVLGGGELLFRERKYAELYLDRFARHHAVEDIPYEPE